MRNRINVAATVVAAVTAIGSLTVGSFAQEPASSEPAKTRQSVFGLDPRNFEHHFGRPVTPQAGPRVAENVRELAENVTEVRVLLTDTPQVVVGEVVTEGKTTLKQFSTALESGAVTFTDDGRPPDQKAGDGVFSARFPLDTRAALKAFRPKLAATRVAVTARDTRTFVRRGPRDIVPAAAMTKSLKINPQRVRVAEQAQDPLEAARELRINAREVPLFTVPLPRPGPDPRDIRRLPRFFDIPILPRFPLPTLPVAVDDARSLMIVDPGTIDDPGRTFDACTGTGTEGGPWSFGHLMREMSHGTGVTPEDFVMHWLSTWLIAQEANGFIVNEPGRAAQLQSRVIASWQQLSPGGTLDVDRFPARLLAIINRPDLADKIGYGTAGSAGEGRFVFGLVERSGGSCFSLPFTVIFEYGIPGGSCQAVKAWHQRWKDLDNHDLGTDDYNEALEEITRDFTDHGSNPAQSPNQSALNQLRTNENALNSLWQMREFRLQPAGASVPPGLLDLVTVKQTPDLVFNGSATLAQYLDVAKAQILNGSNVVPDRFPGIVNPFLAAKSDVPNSGFFWSTDLSGLPPADAPEIRRIFSLGTCSGCHAGETRTLFTHIGFVGTRNLGSPAQLSGFLTGIDVTVPVTGGIHHYNDLAERELKMSTILSQQCFFLLAERRLPFVH